MMAEAFTRSFEVPVTVLRPFNTFGPRQSERAVIPSIIRQMLDRDCPTVRVGDIRTVRDFSFVEDTVAAFLAVGLAGKTDPGRVYNAGSGRAVEISEVIDLLAEIIGSDKRVEQDETRFRPPQSEVLALLADASRLSADTGWCPQVDLREGLRRTVDWWRDRLAAGRVRHGTSFMT